MFSRASRRVIVTILVVCMIASMNIAFAADESQHEDMVEPLRFEGVLTTVVRLNIDSFGWSYNYGYISLVDGYTGECTLELQKRPLNSFYWEEENSWTDSTKPYEIEKDWHVMSGYDYRLCLTTKIYYDGEYVTTAKAWSDIVEYP